MYIKTLPTFMASVLIAALSASSVWSQENDPVIAGKQAPEIKAKTIDDKEFSLEKLKGKVVLVDFWGTWCPPCREELPHLREAYKKFHDKGFEILSIALRDSPETIKAFAKENEMVWTHITDEEFKYANDFQIQVVPTPFLLDHTGKIVLRGSEDMLDSDLRGEQLMKDVEKYIKQLPDYKEES